MYFGLHGDPHHLLAQHDGPWKPTVDYDEKNPYPLPALVFGDPDKARKDGPSKKDLENFEILMAKEEYLANCTIATMDGTAIFVEFDLLATKENPFPLPLWELMFLRPRIYKAVFSPPRLEKAIERSVGKFMTSMAGRVQEEVSSVGATVYKPQQRLHQIFGFIDTRFLLMKSKDFLEKRPCLDIDQPFQLLHLAAVFLGPNVTHLMQHHLDLPPARPEAETSASKAQAFARVWGLGRESDEPEDMEMEAYNALLMQHMMVNAQTCVDVLLGYLFMHMADYLQVPVENGQWMETLFYPRGTSQISLAWETLQRECIDHLAWLPDIEVPHRLKWEEYLTEAEEWYQNVKTFNLPLTRQGVTRPTLIPPTLAKENRDIVDNFYKYFTPPLFEGREVADYPLGLMYQPDVAHGSGQHKPAVTMRMEIVKRGPVEFRRQLRHFCGGRMAYLKERYRNPHVNLATIRMYVYNGVKAKDNDVEYHFVRYKPTELRLKNRYRPVTEPFYTPEPEGAYISKEEFPALASTEPVARTGRSEKKSKPTTGQASTSKSRPTTHRHASRKDTADHRNRPTSRERSDSRRRRKGDQSEERKRAHERSVDRKKKEERKTVRSNEKKKKQEKRRREPTTSPMNLKEDEMEVLDQTVEGEEEENERYMTPVGAVEGQIGPVEGGSAPQPSRPGPNADGPVQPEEKGKKEGVTPSSTERQSESTSAEGQKGRSVSAPPVQQLSPATKTETEKKKKRKQEEEREIPVVVEKAQEEKEAEESPAPLVIDLGESPQSPSVTESQGAGTSDREGGETEGTSPSTDTMVKQLVVETPLMTLKKNEKKEKPAEEQENEVRMATPPPVVQQEQGTRPPLRQQQLPQPHKPGENQDLVPVAPIPITRTEPLHRPLSSAKPPTAQIPPLVTQRDNHLQFSNKPSVYTRLGTPPERTYQRGFESYRPASQDDRTEVEQRRWAVGPNDRTQEPDPLADLPPIPNYRGDFPTIPPPWKGTIRQDQDEPYEYGPLQNYPYQAEMMQTVPYIKMQRPTPAASHYEHIYIAPPEPLLTPPNLLLAMVVDNNMPNRNPEHARGWPTRWLHMINEVVLRVYHTLAAKKIIACEAGSNRIRMEFLRELCQQYQNFLQQAAENAQYSAMEWEILLRVLGKKIRAMLASLLHQKVASGLYTPRLIQDSVTSQEIQVLKWKPKTTRTRENQQKRLEKRFERSETRSDSERSTASRFSRTPDAATAMFPNQQDQEAYDLWLLQHPDYAISPAFPAPQDIQQQGQGPAFLQGQPSRPISQPQAQQDLLQLQYQQVSAQHLYPPGLQQQQTPPQPQQTQPQAQLPQTSQLPIQQQQVYPLTQSRYQQVPAAQQPPQQIQPQWQAAPQQTPMNIQGQQQPEWNWVPQQQYPPVVMPQQTLQPQFGLSIKEQQAMLQTAYTQPAQQRPAVAPYQPTFATVTGSAPVPPTTEQMQQGSPESQKETQRGTVPLRQVSCEVATQYDRGATGVGQPSASTRQPYDPATTDMDTSVEHLSNTVTRGIRLGYNAKQLITFIIGQVPHLFVPEILTEYLREYVLFGTRALPEWFNVQDPNLPLTTNERIGINRAIRRIMGQRQGDDKGLEKGKGKAGPSGGQGR